MHSSNRSRKLKAIWLATAAATGIALLISMSAYDPLADPDPALQRPGFIDTEKASPAPQVTQEVPHHGRRAVIFFDRRIPSAEQLQKLAELQQPLKDTDIALVVHKPAGEVSPPVPVVTDEGGELARAYRLNQPNDDGYPVGYAIVDSNGLIRYPTLDPNYFSLLEEVVTIVRATP